MYTARRPEEEGGESPRARRRAAGSSNQQEQEQEQEEVKMQSRQVPPEATPVDAAKATLGSLLFLATTLWAWARFLLAYFRLDVLVALVLGTLATVWLARHVLGLIVGRMLLPSVFGKSYHETKSAYHEWISAAIDRLIPPPGVDEGRAGAGIINTITGASGKGEKGWLKGKLGPFVIQAVRWGIKRTLGV